MNNETKPETVAAELFMSPAERAKILETASTSSMGARISNAYLLAQAQAADIQEAKALLTKIEKALPRRSFL